MKDILLDISVFEHLPMAVGIANLDGNILFVNKTFTALFGYTHSEIPTIEAWGKLAYPDPDYYKEAFDTWNRTIKLSLETKENQKPNTYRIKCKDGTTKHIEITLNIKENNLFGYFRNVTELVKANESTMKEKLFADKVINSLPGSFYIYKKEGDKYTLYKWNANLEKVTGYSTSELLTMSPLDFFSEKDHPKVIENINKCFQEGFAEADLYFFNKEKKTKPFRFIAYPLEIDGNDYFIGQGIDISKQKETECNLNILFKALPDIIFVTDYSGNIIYINDALEQQTGYSLSDLQNNGNKGKLHTPEDSDMLFQRIKELINSDQKSTGVIENRLYDKDGKLNWYSGVIVKTTYNNEPALLTISRNINQLKNSKKALIESEQRMSAVFDSAPVIMMLINENHEILQINKKGLQSLNYNQKDSRGIAFGKAYKCINSTESPIGCGFGEKCADCVIRSTLLDTFKNGNDHVKVDAVIHSAEKDYHILLSSSILKSSNTKTVLLTIDDITERKIIEEDLRKSKEQAEESDRLKSAFLQNISHEIRTPLNGILGFSGLLDNTELSAEDRKYYIEVINQSSGQLLSIVDDILNLSRLETGQSEVNCEEVYLNGLMDELYTKYSKKANERNLVISHNVEFEDKRAYIFSDLEKLRQILDSLLSNALKFTKKGHIIYGYRFKQNMLEFYVEDTGIGIAPEYHGRIFERFLQVDGESTRIYGGTGLGLTIAKANTQLLGGCIWVESELDSGSRFYFTIPYTPVYEEQEEEAIIQPKQENSIANELTVLVAEDEEINYLYIEESLRNLDYKLIHVYNGLEAVNECINNKDIDLVLMDIKMPKMDGYEAFKEIKKIRPELPVIAQTAYAMLADKEKAMNAGFKAYLSKPIKSKDLVDVIAKFS